MIVREIPYVDPPTAFARWRQAPFAAFLDSAATDDPRSRYSYIAVEPFRTLVADGAGVRIDGRLDYESFLIDGKHECVRLAEAAVAAAGRKPIQSISNGGLDANWLNAHGIPTVTLGCGQMDVHMTSEKLELAAFRDACRIALMLATGQ